MANTTQANTNPVISERNMALLKAVLDVDVAKIEVDWAEAAKKAGMSSGKYARDEFSRLRKALTGKSSATSKGSDDKKENDGGSKGKGKTAGATMSKKRKTESDDATKASNKRAAKKTKADSPVAVDKNAEDEPNEAAALVEDWL